MAVVGPRGHECVEGAAGCAHRPETPLTQRPVGPTMGGPRFTGSPLDPGTGTNASGCVPVVP